MSGGMVVFVILIVGSVGGFVMKMRNERYASSEDGIQEQQAVEKFARDVLMPDEKLILADYGVGTMEKIALSDRRIYYLKKDGTMLKIPYSDIKKCKCENFMGNKVKPDGDVVNIIITTNNGKYTLFSFLRARDIARELDARI